MRMEHVAERDEWEQIMRREADKQNLGVDLDVFLDELEHDEDDVDLDDDDHDDVVVDVSDSACLDQEQHHHLQLDSCPFTDDDAEYDDIVMDLADHAPMPDSGRTLIDQSQHDQNSNHQDQGMDIFNG